MPQKAFLSIKANGEIQKDVKEVIKNDTKDYIKKILLQIMPFLSILYIIHFI